VTNIINSLYNSDEEDTTISQAHSFKSTKGGYKLSRQGESSDTLLSVEESSVNIGGKEGVVRLQDKSKRAFDTSVESTRALELAI
jgi:predicted AlkP superfamily phosphohydrolase/phosphomutase